MIVQFYLYFYLKILLENILHINKSFEEVRKVSQVPIYGLWDFYLNSGMVGGLLTSAIAQGDTVSKMALDVLNGKDIKDIPVVEKSPNLYIFNYDELKRFNLNVSKIY